MPPEGEFSMSRARLLLRAATILAVVMLALAAGYGTMEVLEEHSKAHGHYAETAAELERINDRLRQSEQRLQRLTSSLEAVELEARHQFRMIKPGETLVLVRPDDE